MPKLPPAEKGHRKSVKHDAKAQVLPARLEAKSAELAKQIAAAAPVRNPDGSLPVHDQVAVQMLASALCRLEDVGVWLDEHGVLDAKGKPRSAAGWERRLQSHALKLMASLGMTPQSRAKLGLNLAKTADLAQAMSNPNPVQKAREMAELGLSDDVIDADVTEEP
jgi:hypothetical protein